MEEVVEKASFEKYPAYKDSGVEWLGEIPKHWEVRRLKYVFSIKKRIAGQLGFDVLSITLNGIKIKDIESGEGQLSMDYSKYQLVYKGDFAMNHMDLLTGYVDISNYNGVVSPDYRVFTLIRPDCNARYLLLLFQLGYKSRIFYAYGQGVSQLGRWRFPAENFNNFQIPIPPFSEQVSIASFLDRKTAQIDKAISIKEKQIELLKERRQILIHQAVTRGLDPNVRMKDSGVEWIGEIPEHWVVKKVNYIFKKIGSGTTPTAGDAKYYDGEINWLQTGDLNDGYIKETNKNITLQAQRKFSALKIYPAGSLVIAMYGATIGKLGLLQIETTTNQACCVLSSPDSMNVKFAFFWFMGSKQKIISMGYGGGQPNISQDLIKSIRLTVPPLEEQNEIVNYLEKVTEKIIIAMHCKELEIEKLKEYKATLINSTVTGKIQVS